MGGTAEDVFRPYIGAKAFFYLLLWKGVFMKISKELVEYLAKISKIKLNDGQAEKAENELRTAIEYMDILNELDTDGIEPLSHIYEVSNVMRKDEVRPSYDRSALLENAPERTDETVIVPKTVE